MLCLRSWTSVLELNLQKRRHGDITCPTLMQCRSVILEIRLLRRYATMLHCLSTVLSVLAKSAVVAFQVLYPGIR